MGKMYQKPVIEVVEYTPNQAVSACGTSQYVQCLIGGQELVFYSSCSGGSISEFYEYTVNGVTYIIWKYNYGTGPGDTDGDSWNILNDWLDKNADSSDVGLGWHIGLKTSFENLYGNS